MILTYPCVCLPRSARCIADVVHSLDVIKTQAQQLVKASATGDHPNTSLRGIATTVWVDGRLDAQRRDPRFATRSALGQMLRSARGFGRGFKLGVVTSALQSALILPVFELLGAFLAGR
jgi:hypothetical protein